MTDRPAARWWPFAALVVGAAFWGGTWPAGRAAYTDIPPITLAAARWGIAALLLTPFCLTGLCRYRHQIRRQWRRLLVTSALGLAIFTALILTGLRSTSAINGALINAATPVYILVLSLVGIGERCSWREGWGALIALGGLVIILTRGEPTRIIALDVNVGDLWILAAMLLWALYNIVLRQWKTDLPPFLFLYVQILIAVVFLTPAMGLELAAGNKVVLSRETLLAMFYLGTGSSIGAYACWIYGVQRLGAARASLFQYLIPVFAALFAVLLLSESLHWFHLGGISLIAAGIIFANRGSQPTT